MIRFSGLGVVLAIVGLSASGAPASADESGDAVLEEGYVGDEVCLSCHETMHEGLAADYAKTIHARVLGPEHGRNALMKRGCEACHGPGKAHVDAGGGEGVGGMRSFESDDPAQQKKDSEVCLACHKGGARLYWNGSVHDGNEVGCTSCHTLMKQVSTRNQLSHEKIRETCASCHLIENARQYRNAHMPLREDKMTCTSCHNPHGTVSESLIDANTVNDKCFQCHADKRGPYLWEHPPVTENCLNCHDPHGTTRNNLLKRGVPRLCQSCHILTRHPSQPHTPPDRFVLGDSCLQCHPNIHGSNHPSGNRFTR
jgi:DmsE family decaheme c-type cytochrome